MCILPLAAEVLDRTLLVSAPATLSGSAATLMAYRNNLRDASGRGQHPLMIVPFPNDVGPDLVVGLFSDDTPGFSDLLSTIDRTTEPPPAYDGFLLAKESFRSPYGPAYVPVVQVGRYRVSVVPDGSSVRTRVDWSKFHLPHDFQRRMTTIDDAEVMGGRPMAYAIVQATAPSVEASAFGVVYPGWRPFFPTCHEAGHRYEYNVKCVGLNSVPVHPFGGAVTVWPTHVTAAVRTAALNVAPSGVMSVPGSTEVTIGVPLNFVASCVIKGTYLTNYNVWGASVGDVGDGVDVGAPPPALTDPPENLVDLPHLVDDPPPLVEAPPPSAARKALEDMARKGTVFSSGASKYGTGVMCVCDMCGNDIRNQPIVSYSMHCSQDVCISCAGKVWRSDDAGAIKML